MRSLLVLAALAFKAVDANITPDIVARLISWADANHDGSLQLDEFLSLAAEMIRSDVVNIRNLVDFSPVRDASVCVSKLWLTAFGRQRFGLHTDSFESSSGERDDHMQLGFEGVRDVFLAGSEDGEDAPLAWRQSITIPALMYGDGARLSVTALTVHGCVRRKAGLTFYNSELTSRNNSMLIPVELRALRRCKLVFMVISSNSWALDSMIQVRV
jgi:hypothetical protein